MSQVINNANIITQSVVLLLLCLFVSSFICSISQFFVYLLSIQVLIYSLGYSFILLMVILCRSLEKSKVKVMKLSKPESQKQC